MWKNREEKVFIDIVFFFLTVFTLNKSNISSLMSSLEIYCSHWNLFPFLNTLLLHSLEQQILVITQQLMDSTLLDKFVFVLWDQTILQGSCYYVKFQEDHNHLHSFPLSFLSHFVLCRRSALRCMWHLGHIIFIDQVDRSVCVGFVIRASQLIYSDY